MLVWLLIVKRDGIISASFSGEHGFKSQPKDWLFRLGMFVIFLIPSPLRAISSTIQGMLASAKPAKHGDNIHLRLLHISAVSAGRQKAKNKLQK
jgi:hypothetical protein